MTLKHHFRMTASEIAMGRYMRAPDHSAADEFAAAFDQFGKEPAAGAADDKGGAGDGDGSGAGAAPAGESGGAAPGGGDGGAADDKGAAPAAADDKGGAPAAGDGATAEGADDKGGAPAGDDKGGGAGGDGKAPAAPAADDKGGAAPAKAPAAPAAPAGESDDDVLKRLAAAVKKVGTEEAPAKPAAEAPQEEPLFSQEETAKIEHFRKEWPEVAEAFDLQARALAQSVLKYAFEQIGGVVNPMRETLDILATRTHYGDLKAAVGEYTAEERDAIVKWVDQQPTYLQAAMKSVIDGGTAEEVADLVGRYREATGQAKPAGAGDAGGAAPGGDVELSDEAKKAAAALAPVSTKRSAVQAPDDKSDFDGAFAKFADVLG